MTTDLREIYDLFDRHLSRMNADLEIAVQHLPETQRAAFMVPRLDFAEFCAFWARISADPTMSQHWTKRLAPGGYEAEREAVRSALACCSNAHGTAAAHRREGGKEAA